MLGQESLLCFDCGALHHHECWAWNGKCGRYACQSKEALLHTVPAFRVIPGTAPPPELQAAEDAAITGDWERGWELDPRRLLKRVV